MKGKYQIAKKQSILKGASTAFNIMGDGLETRTENNLEASWYNVGVFYKRAMDNISIKGGYSRRFIREEEMEKY